MSDSTITKDRFLSKLPLWQWILLGTMVIGTFLGHFMSNEAPKLKLEEKRDYPANASASETDRINKDNDAIEKSNVAKQKEHNDAMKKYTEGGKEAREGWIIFLRWLGMAAAVLLVAGIVIVYGLKPLMEGLHRFFDRDVALVLTPLVLIGVTYVLSSLLLQISGAEMAPTTPGFKAGIFAIIANTLRPVATAIVELTNFLFKNWIPGTAYLLVILFVCLKKLMGK